MSASCLIEIATIELSLSLFNYLIIWLIPQIFFSSLFVVPMFDPAFVVVPSDALPPEPDRRSGEWPDQLCFALLCSTDSSGSFTSLFPATNTPHLPLSPTPQPPIFLSSRPLPIYRLSSIAITSGPNDLHPFSLTVLALLTRRYLTIHPT